MQLLFPLSTGLFALLLSTNVAISYSLAGAGGNFGLGIDRTKREVTGKIFGDRIERSKLDKRLYYSFTIVGDQEALDGAIDSNGIAIHVTIFCNNKKKDRFYIGVDQDILFLNTEKFRSEIDKLGIFTWKTHFNTRKITCNKLDFIIDGPSGTLKTIGGGSNFTPSIRIY